MRGPEPTSPEGVDDAERPPSRQAAELERRRQELIARVGPWRFHNIELGDGVFTIGAQARAEEWRLPPIVRLVEDVLGSVEGLRVLDLGCMEGLFSIELAKRGAQVLGIEGREAHVARAEFARQALGLGNAEFRLGDVRGLSRDEYGEFDLVLALGILYHLDHPDVFRFAERLAEVCTRVAIVDTHYSLRPVTEWDYGGATYAGIEVREHDPGDTARDRQRSYGSSLGNLRSVWLTRSSLFNLLADAGFGSVLEAQVPRVYQGQDRVHLVALKALKGGQGTRPRSVPYYDSWRSPRWPERERVRPSRQQRRGERAMVRLAPLVPGSLRRSLIRRRRAARGT